MQIITVRRVDGKDDLQLLKEQTLTNKVPVVERNTAKRVEH